MATPTRFKAKSIPSINYSIERMSRKISTEAKCSVELVKRMGELAINEWQAESGIPVRNLFVLDWEKRADHMNQILYNFKVNMRPLIMSEKRLNKAMNIAQASMEIALDLM